MPLVVKAAELVVEGIERLSPGAVESGLDLLKVAGEKRGLLKGAPLHAFDDFIGGAKSQIHAEFAPSELHQIFEGV